MSSEIVIVVMLKFFTLNVVLSISSLLGVIEPLSSEEFSHGLGMKVTLIPSSKLWIARRPHNFIDVPSEFWAHVFIQNLATHSTIVGDINGNFRPNEPMNRAEFAALLNKSFTQATNGKNTQFTDVPTSHWGYKVIQKANQAGFLKGYNNGQFKPNQNISRFEVLLSLVSGLRFTPNQPYIETVSFYRMATRSQSG